MYQNVAQVSVHAWAVEPVIVFLLFMPFANVRLILKINSILVL